MEQHDRADESGIDWSRLPRIQNGEIFARSVIGWRVVDLTWGNARGVFLEKRKPFE